MMNEKDAREMAKYIVMGVEHFDKKQDKINVTMDILKKYNLIEKEKSVVFGNRVMGTSAIKNSPEMEEDFYNEKA